MVIDFHISIANNVKNEVFIVCIFLTLLALMILLALILLLALSILFALLVVVCLAITCGQGV